MTKRESEQIRSQRIGLRFQGIAEEPTCAASTGSSISRRCARSRTSVANLCAD